MNIVNRAKSRLFDGFLDDFDAGVLSVLGTVATSAERQMPTRKAVKAAAIAFAERNGCLNFKASDGWTEKFIRRKFPEYKISTMTKKQDNAQPQKIGNDEARNPVLSEAARNFQTNPNIFNGTLAASKVIIRSE